MTRQGIRLESGKLAGKLLLRLRRKEVIFLKRLIKLKEEPIDQLLAELDYCLTDAVDKLPELEDALQDVQRTCRVAHGIVRQLEERLLTNQPKK